MTYITPKKIKINKIKKLYLHNTFKRFNVVLKYKLIANQNCYIDYFVNQNFCDK